MEPSTVFQVVNVLPLPIWLVWMAAPRSRLARTLARSLWPWGVLAALYTAIIVGVLARGGLDPGAYASLGGVMALFDVEWIALAGWVHYLCFDLFVGRWIMNDAPDAGYWLTPILLLTFMFGPVGLLAYLGMRGGLGFDR